MLGLQSPYLQRKSPLGLIFLLRDDGLLEHVGELQRLVLLAVAHLPFHVEQLLVLLIDQGSGGVVHLFPEQGAVGDHFLHDILKLAERLGHLVALAPYHAPRHLMKGLGQDLILVGFAGSAEGPLGNVLGAGLTQSPASRSRSGHALAP